MVLPVYGCESIQVRRYLEALYCPEALILKGAETLVRDGGMEAQLASLTLSCDVAVKGSRIDDPNFGVTDIDLRLTFRGEVKASSEAADAFELPLFVALLHRQDNRLRWQQTARIRAAEGAFSHSLKITFPQVQKINKAEYILPWRVYCLFSAN